MNLKKKRKFNAAITSAEANGALAILSLAFKARRPFFFIGGGGVKMEPDPDLKPNEARGRANREENKHRSAAATQSSDTPEQLGRGLLRVTWSSW